MPVEDPEELVKYTVLVMDEDKKEIEAQCVFDSEAEAEAWARHTRRMEPSIPEELTRVIKLYPIESFPPLMQRIK